MRGGIVYKLPLLVPTSMAAQLQPLTQSRKAVASDEHSALPRDRNRQKGPARIHIDRRARLSGFRLGMDAKLLSLLGRPLVSPN